MKRLTRRKAAKFGNYNAVQRLKQLQIDQRTEHQKERIINDAFHIYWQIREQRNHHVINSMLHLCLKHDHCHNITAIWSDIERVIQSQKSHTKLSYSLLLKCTIESDDVSKSFQILQWIETSNYTLKIHDRYIRKLLSQCTAQFEIVFIHRLLTEKFIENNNLMLTPSLIEAFGRCGDIHGARNAFNFIQDSEKDIFIIATMMKILLTHHHYEEVLRMYCDVQTVNERLIHDDVTSMLALRACMARIEKRASPQRSAKDFKLLILDLFCVVLLGEHTRDALNLGMLSFRSLRYPQ